MNRGQVVSWASTRFEYALETVIYFALVGLVWYVVGIEIGAKGTKCTHL